MCLIRILVAIDFHDTDDIGLVFDLHGEDTDYARLGLYGLSAHVVRGGEVVGQIAIVYFNLSNPDYETLGLIACAVRPFHSELALLLD